MLLAIDVGNTNIVIGVFRGDALVHTWRLTTIRERTSDELGILMDVLGSAAQFWEEQGESFVAVFVDPRRELDLPAL